MSLLITTDVQCDGAGCLNWVHGATGFKRLARQARNRAIQFGWTNPGPSVDLCPTCSDQPATPDELALIETLHTEAGQ